MNGVIGACGFETPANPGKVASYLTQCACKIEETQDIDGDIPLSFFNVGYLADNSNMLHVHKWFSNFTGGIKTDRETPEGDEAIADDAIAVASTFGTSKQYMGKQFPRKGVLTAASEIMSATTEVTHPNTRIRTRIKPRVIGAQRSD